MANLRDSDIPDTYICPGCGDEVRVGVRGCRRCSQALPYSEKNSKIPDCEQVDPYSEDTGYEEPDGRRDFDYDGYRRSDFGDFQVDDKAVKGFTKDGWVKFIASVLIIIFLYMIVNGLW